MRILLKLILLLSALYVGTINAEELPNYYSPSQHVQNFGSLDRIDTRNREIVIGDILYRLADQVMVHSMRSEFEPLSRVEVGPSVKFRYIDTDDGQKLVTEIWIMPQDYREAESD